MSWEEGWHFYPKCLKSVLENFFNRTVKHEILESDRLFSTEAFSYLMSW